MAEQLISDLLKHQAWADAEHWNALTAFPAGLEDAAIRDRLNHIHITQTAFITIVRHRPLDHSLFRMESDMVVLKRKVRALHDEIDQYLSVCTDAMLEETLAIPWFKDPPVSLTVRSALTQAAMHSHYHRAQNALRLRELGGEPSGTDLIVWYWKGKPVPGW